MQQHRNRIHNHRRNHQPPEIRVHLDQPRPQQYLLQKQLQPQTVDLGRRQWKPERRPLRRLISSLLLQQVSQPLPKLRTLGHHSQRSWWKRRRHNPTLRVHNRRQMVRNILDSSLPMGHPHRQQHIPTDGLRRINNLPVTERVDPSFL